MHENEIGVVSPVGLPGHQQTAIAPRLETLQGKTIGEVYNHHFKGDQMFGMSNGQIIQNGFSLMAVNLGQLQQEVL
jgi:hypothetical protein